MSLCHLALGTLCDLMRHHCVWSWYKIIIYNQVPHYRQCTVVVPSLRGIGCSHLDLYKNILHHPHNALPNNALPRCLLKHAYVHRQTCVYPLYWSIPDTPPMLALTRCSRNSDGPVVSIRKGGFPSPLWFPVCIDSNFLFSQHCRKLPKYSLTCNKASSQTQIPEGTRHKSWCM